MRAFKIKALLAMGLMSVVGGLAAAQSEPEAQVSGEMAAVGHARDSVRILRAQSLSGTIVSLETYLRDGADAARAVSASDEQTDTSRALLTDSDEVYLLVNGAEAQAITQRPDEDQYVSVSEADADPGREPATVDGNAAMERDIDRSAAAGDRGQRSWGDWTFDPAPRSTHRYDHRNALAAIDADRRVYGDDSARLAGRAGSDRAMDAERQARTGADPMVIEENDALASGGMAAELPTERTRRIDDGGVIIEEDVPADTQVYGMAELSDSRAAEFKIGERVTLTGDVYERGGIRSLLPSEPAAAE